jgi:hypothetical protein
MLTGIILFKKALLSGNSFGSLKTAIRILPGLFFVSVIFRVTSLAKEE